MIKITAVAPDEQLGRLFEDTFQEHDEYLYTNGPSNDEYEIEVIIEHEHDNIRQLNIDADVVVARGYTAQILLEQNSSIPVVKLPVTGNDIIRSLVQCREAFPHRKPIIMGTRNIIFQFESLFEIFGQELTPVLLTEQTEKEITTMFSLMVNRDENVIIGGRKVCEYAESRGIPRLPLQSGRLAVWQTISEAKRVASISRTEQEKAMRYKSVLDCTTEGILVIDKDQKVSVLNSTCEEILGIRADSVLQKEVKKVFAHTQLLPFILRQGSYRDELLAWKGQNLAANKDTVIHKAEKVGSVITLQRRYGYRKRKKKYGKRFITAATLHGTASVT